MFGRRSDEVRPPPGGRAHVYFLLGVCAWVLGWGAWLCWPLSEDTLAQGPIASLRYLDRDGHALGEQVGALGTRTREVPLSEISAHVTQCLLAAEDKRFFEHFGIDPVAIGRAVYQNISAYRIVSGGSTLTQQLARLLLAEASLRDEGVLPGRGVWQKIREARLAVRLERRFDKERILAAFLNRAPFGRNATGIAAASERYFRVSPKALSLAQSAFLAGLIKGPSAYDPVTQFARAKARQEMLLDRLAMQGRISPGERLRARDEPLSIARTPPVGVPESAHARALARAELARLGLPAHGEVRLTLDLELQRQVQDIVADEVPRLHTRGGKSAAVVVIDNATGEIRALVGSAFLDNPRWGQYSAATAERQPGSALKPFLYAAALAKGKTAASLAADIDKPYPDTWGVYMPDNYDQRFHGAVRYREALAQSLNVAAVDVLATVGLDTAFTLLDRLGLKTLDRRPSYFGLGLALGSGGVRLVDLTNAYAALARGGVARPWTLLARHGSAVLPAPKAGERVLDERVAYIVADMLSDPHARTPQFGPHSVLTTPFWSAVKTGTSKGFRDNWTVGFTPETTVGVWVGNPSGEPMHGVSGVEGAGGIWRRVMRLTTPYHTEKPKEPAGITHVRICALSGQRLGAHCPGGRDEMFVQGTEPVGACEFHRQARLDAAGALIPDGCDKVAAATRLVTVFPGLFGAWAEAHGAGMAERIADGCAKEASRAARITLVSPAKSERLRIDPDAPRQNQALELSALVDGGQGPVTFLVDGLPLVTVPPPYRAFWPLLPGEHRIKARLGEHGPESAEHRVWVR